MPIPADATEQEWRRFGMQRNWWAPTVMRALELDIVAQIDREVAEIARCALPGVKADPVDKWAAWARGERPGEQNGR